MHDPAAFLDAVDRLADRFRSLPQSRLLAAVPGHDSRAAAGFALASWLAEAAQRLEEPGAAPRALPFAGPFAVGDQIAVTGHDLALAVRAGGRRARETLDAALRRVEETRGLVA
ncbi:hypothetical protein GCM10027168_33480 [Streptomyces capparidis]